MGIEPTSSDSQTDAPTNWATHLIKLVSIDLKLLVYRNVAFVASLVILSEFINRPRQDVLGVRVGANESRTSWIGCGVYRLFDSGIIRSVRHGSLFEWSTCWELNPIVIITNEAALSKVKCINGALARSLTEFTALQGRRINTNASRA